MTATSTDTRQSMECPPLEDIAAFIDNTLSPEERARVTEHLARCENCYEVFSGAIHFSSAEGTGGRGVPPLPLEGEHHSLGGSVHEVQIAGVLREPMTWDPRKRNRTPQRRSRWFAIAASVIFVVTLGGIGWRYLFAPTTITTAALAKTLEGKSDLTPHLYAGDTFRGVDEQEDLPGSRPYFMTGVHLIDLQVSVNARNVEATASHLREVGLELKEILFAGDLAERCSNEYLALKDTAALERFAPKLPSLVKEIEQSLAEDPAFSFGLWTEAGRLAAIAGSPELFERRDNRRFLSLVQKDVPVAEEIQEQVLNDLRAVQSIWEKGDFSENDYRALATHFQSIIERIDKYK